MTKFGYFHLWTRLYRWKELLPYFRFQVVGLKIISYDSNGKDVDMMFRSQEGETIVSKVLHEDKK